MDSTDRQYNQTDGYTNAAFDSSYSKDLGGSQTFEGKKDIPMDVIEDGKSIPSGKQTLDDLEIEQPPQSPEEDKKETFLIMKNILLISLSFLLTFNAYQGLARLQSSLHVDEGMGVINQSVLYGCLVVSCFFLPKLLVGLIGHKWTIPLSFCGYIAWMAANGYAVWGTMVTASVLVGFAAAPLWTAQCSYFIIVTKRYAKLTGESEENVVTRFFGIFFCFFQMSNITGSIISSVVLTPDGDYEPGEEILQFCGKNDCPGDNITFPDLSQPSKTTVWILVGIYIAVGVMSVLMVCIFVDPLPDRYVRREKVKLKDIAGLISATARHLRHKKQLILIPMTMYSGFEQAFYGAEFSKSFVTCSVGIWKVGLVTIGFGIVNAIVSFTSGRVAKYTGRLPIFLAGFVVDLAIQITFMIWTPRPSQEYVLYILACMYGFTDGIWQTQINAMYGYLFAKESEAAFSNYRMWESLGFIIAFAYSSFLCTSHKTYILTSVLVVGVAGYVYVELEEKFAKKRRVEISS